MWSTSTIKGWPKGEEPGAPCRIADNKSDAFVSIGTFIGIIAAQFHLAWIDTVTAFVIGLLICKTAWDIFKESSHSLTDGFDVKDISAYKQTIERSPE